MKAIGKLKKEPGLWLYDAPIPKIGPHELLVKVKKSAICGTDLHIYQWDKWAQETIPVPITIGHEFFGIVEKVGKEVKNFKPGDRVAAEGHLTCDVCRNCRAGKRHYCRSTVGLGVHCNGGFAEYVALPAANAFAVPSDVSDDVASFLDPLGNAVHTVLSFDCVGEDVLITGAGPIGMMAVAIAKHAGARHIVITDINDYRLKLAKKMGATRAVNITKTKLSAVMKELNITEGFGVGYEMSGSPSALAEMIEAASYGGKIALLGILPDGAPAPWTKIIFKSLRLKGIYGREMFETWYKMISMLQSGLDVAPVVTHRFAGKDFQKAFDAMLKGQTGKVILEW